MQVISGKAECEVDYAWNEMKLTIITKLLAIIRPEGAKHVSPATQQAEYPGNRGRDERWYHARLACTTLGRGCAALGYGWQNQRKALKGRNKWRTQQTPICKPGQATTRTNAEHCRGGSSIAPPLHLASGNRHTGRWRLLRPFRAIRNVVLGNPGPRDRSQDSRSLALGCHVTAPSGQRDVGSILR